MVESGLGPAVREQLVASQATVPSHREQCKRSEVAPLNRLFGAALIESLDGDPA
jgi:hypothetical protein